MAGEKIGEADIWPPSNLWKSLSQVFDLEYIEVYKPHRSKGLGRAAMNAVFNEMGKRGYRSLVLWTETDNVAMHGLAKAAGLQPGPALSWLDPIEL